MHNRLIRSSILTLLIAVGIGAAYVLWDSQQQSIAIADRSRELNTRLDAMLADLSELGAAQQAYVALGQTDAPWIARVSSLLQRLFDEAGALRAYASPSAASTLSSMRERLDALVAIDARAREYLHVGQELMAADLVFNEARETLTTIATSVRTLRTADATGSRDVAQARNTQQASVLGGAAAIWLIGIVLLVRVPRSQSPGLPLPVSVPSIDTVASADATANPIAAPAPSIDWSRAADVCGDLARLTDGATLPALFTSIAQAVDASGVILWLGAGEQLFAAAAHGYNPRVLARLGPIGRSADNATAAAWRDGQLHTVTGDMVTNGAIVAPLVGHEGCRGVLAVELRDGRESNPAARAVIVMIAAQLVGLVAAWPAASSAAPEQPPIAQAI